MFEHKRFVTILYADISGFTDLTNKIGAEKTTDFINECFNAIDGIIHRYNGSVIRHEGDRVMAVFGYPLGFGDDSSNALMAGLKIKDEIKKMRYKIDIHIGIGSGTVLVKDNKVYGQLIDEVSLLEENAKRDEIVVNNACYNINKCFFDFTEEENGFLLIGAKTCEKGSPVIFDTYIDEFTTFNEAIFKTPQFIFVSGQKGSGKSTFIQYSLTKINTNNQLNIYEIDFIEQNTTSTPFLNVVSKINPDFDCSHKAKFEGEDYQLRLFREMAELLLCSCKENPLVLVLKNFDIIDGVSTLFIKYLANAIKNEKIILIFETRKKESQLFEKTSVIKNINLTTIALKPMSNDIILKIITNILNNYEFTNDFRENILALCSGNPFCAVEVANFIKDSYAPGTKLKEIPFVNHIRQITQAIVDTIPEKYLSGLLILSLWDGEIDLLLCHKLIPDTEAFLNFCQDKNLLYDDGKKLYFKSQLIKRTIFLFLSRKMAQGLHYKIAQAIKSYKNSSENYGIIAYHLKEANARDESLEYLNQWAEYLWKEHQYEKCLAVFNDILEFIPDEQIEQKLELLLKRVELLHILGYREQELQEIESTFKIATEKHYEQFYSRISYARARYLEAIANYDDALKIYNELYITSQDRTLLEKIGINYYYKNDLNTAMDIFNQLMTMLDGTDNYLLLGTVLNDLGLCYWKKGDKDRALYYYSKARTNLEKANDTAGISNVIVNVANVYYYLGKIEQAMVNYQEVLKIANKTNNLSLTAQVLSNMGGIYIQLGDYEEALKIFNEALEIDRKTLNLKGEAIRLSNIGCIYGLIGDINKALKNFLEALHLDEEMKNLSGMAIRLGNIANCFVENGEYDQAIDYFIRAVTISEQMNLKDYLAYYNTYLGLAYLKYGQLEKAQIHLLRGKEFSLKAKTPSYEIIASSNLGLYYLKIGDNAKALASSAWAVESLLNLSNFEGNKEQLYFTHYEILRQMGKTSEANRYLKMAYDEIINKASKIVSSDFQKQFLNAKRNQDIIESWKQVKNQE